MVGGPLGALFGAAVGHNLEAARKAERPEAVSDERSRSDFLATTFQLMGYVAKADGRVSEQEIAVTRAMMERLQLSASQRRAAIDCFTEGKQPAFVAEAVLASFRNSYHGRPALAQRLLVMLLNLAYADGALHPQTQARLSAIAERLGLARLQFEAMHTLFRAQRWAQEQAQGHYTGSAQSNDQQTYNRRPTTAVNSLAQAYTVLGLKPSANPEQIKLAYRRLLKRHHPDKLAADNSSPAELLQATEKTREITAAYERIREARGL